MMLRVQRRISSAAGPTWAGRRSRKRQRRSAHLAAVAQERGSAEPYQGVGNGASWYERLPRKCPRSSSSMASLQTFLQRAAVLRAVLAIAFLSVCLSATRRYCVKTNECRMMPSSLEGSTIVFWRYRFINIFARGQPVTQVVKIRPARRAVLSATFCIYILTSYSLLQL